LELKEVQAMTTPKFPEGYGNKTTLTPTRSYELPGGPAARNLGNTEVKILSDFERGSDEDRGFGNKR
jgi:hypothetical protein